MEYAIHTLFNRTAHRMQNDLRPRLAALGLSPGQPKVLRCLATHGPCSQRMLADYCEVDPSAICRVLDSMERAGLLCRRPSKNDRRTDEVAITEKGRRVFVAAERSFQACEDQLLQGFSEEERARLQQMLTRMYRNLGGRII